MSLLFKPPIARARAVSAADLVRLGADGDAFWERVRFAQLDFLTRYMPFNLGMQVMLMLLMLGAFAERLAGPVLAGWGLVLGVLSVWWVVRRIHELRRGDLRATRRLTQGVIVELALAGAAWGLLYADLLPRLDGGELALAGVMVLAALGCAAYTTAIFPAGALALVGPLSAGVAAGMAGAIARGAAFAESITLVIAAFALIGLRGNIVTSFAFLARLRTQEELSRQEELVRCLLNEFEENGSDWLFQMDGHRRLQLVSQRGADAARASVARLLGHGWAQLAFDRASLRPIQRAMRQGLSFRDVLVRLEVGGETRHWQLSGTPRTDAAGRVEGYRGVGNDVSEQMLSAARMEALKERDALTGLANRHATHAALAAHLAGPGGVALLLVDLDRFKAVNETLGHAAGDAILCEAGRRLADGVAGRGLVGRIGADEFAVVLASCPEAEARRLAADLVARLSIDYQPGDWPVPLSATAGLAIGPEDGDTVEALLVAAGLALDEGKHHGSGLVRRADAELHRAVEERRRIERDLALALERDQLWVAFQPVVDALDEHVLGFEALLRWTHPVRGAIPPAEFIPVAERTGLIAALGRYALHRALEAAAAWPANLRVAVNLSPRQFEVAGLVDDVATALAATGVAAQRLELELTESLFLEAHSHTLDVLHSLRALGISFALDDFGTGYSSLGYLSRFAVDRIKIDRSFVRASVDGEASATAVIQTIINLADRLGIETVAEGTETRAEFEAMRRLGCSSIQGFFFGRPMRFARTLEWMARRESLIVVDAA